MNINVSELIKACDKVAQRCIKIANTQHGSAWLFDKLMRYFESEIGAESVTIPIFINAPVMQYGVATIHRDGRLEMSTVGGIE